MNCDRRSLAEVCAYVLIALASAAVVLSLYLLDPVRYVLVVGEDHVGENWTAVAQLAAAGLLLVAVLLPGPPARRVVWTLLALACFLVGMEEISWGQRLLDYQTPQVMRQMNRQGEMNLHNALAVSSLHRAAGGAIAAWLVVSALPRTWRRWWERCGLPIAPPAVWPWAVLTVALCFGPSLIVNTLEIIELSLAIMLAVLALHLLLAHACLPRLWRTPAARIAATAAVMLLTLAAARVLVKFHTPWLGDRYAWSAQDYAGRGLPHQALQIYDYLAQNPRLRTDDLALDHARLLLAEGQPDRAAVLLHDELVRLEREGDDDLDTLRRRLAMHRLLGEADRVADYQAQLTTRVDAALAQGPDADGEALIRWVLAKVEYDDGRPDEALVAAAEAFQLAHQPHLRNDIDLWVRINYKRTLSGK